MAKRQGRVELKGSTRAALPGGQDTGPADPNQQIEVSSLFAAPIKARRISTGRANRRAPSARTKISHAKGICAAHGAAAADIKKIRAFAAQYGLQVVNEDRASRMVKLSGTVQAFSEAFGVDLRCYEHSAGAYRCRRGSLTIPAELELVVEGVFGLDNRPQAKAHFRLRKEKPGVHAQAAAVSYSPLQVAQAYGFPSGTTGAGQCIGVIELGGGYRASDLDAFFREPWGGHPEGYGGFRGRRDKFSDGRSKRSRWRSRAGY